MDSAKGGIWTRIRNGYGNASAALSGLSISGEKDGEGENDTIVHHALVRYYTASGSGTLPSWLGPVPQRSAYSQPVHQNSSQSSVGSGSGRPSTARGGSALEDIYKRREQRMQQQPPASSTPPPPPGHRMPMKSQTFNLGDQPSAAPPQRQDRFRNKLKSAGRANW